MCVCVHTCAHMRTHNTPWSPEKGIRSPITEVRGSCEPFYVGSGNLTGNLCKSSEHTESLCHPSIFGFHWFDKNISLDRCSDLSNVDLHWWEHRPMLWPQQLWPPSVGMQTDALTSATLTSISGNVDRCSDLSKADHCQYNAAFTPPESLFFFIILL